MSIEEVYKIKKGDYIELSHRSDFILIYKVCEVSRQSTSSVTLRCVGQPEMNTIGFTFSYLVKHGSRLLANREIKLIKLLYD